MTAEVAGLLAACGVLALGALLVHLARVRAGRRVVARLDRVARSASSGPGLVRRGRPVGGGRPPAWFVRLVRRSGSPVPPGSWWVRWASVGVGLPVVALVLAGPWLAMAVGLLAAAGPLTWLRVRRGRDRRVLAEALPGVVDDLARSLRSGRSLPGALAEVAGGDHGPWDDDLRALAAAIDRGGTVAGELETWAGRERCDGARLLVAALALGAEGGGSRARALDAVSATLRSRAGVRAELEAGASPARASALVMAATPAAFAVLAAATDPRIGGFLVHDPLGVGCLVAGGGLDLAALAWMSHLTGGAEA